MGKDLFGLGDNDIAELDRKNRDELLARNPDNQPEVTLEMWTLAHLTRGDQKVRTVVFGVVSECLTDDYMTGDIVCSTSLLDTPPHPKRRIYVSQALRFECKGAGSEITIPENELNSRLPDFEAGVNDIERHQSSGEE